MVIVHLDGYDHAALYARIAAKYPDLSEISGSVIDDKGLQALSLVYHSTLTSIVVNKATIISDNTILRLCKGSTSLTKLCLTTSNSVLTDDSVCSIATCCPKIECLSLEGWTNLTDAAMVSLQSLGCLKDLNLSYCTSLTSDGVQSLLSSVGARLEVLILSHSVESDKCKYCNDALVRFIGQSCPVLKNFVVEISTESDVSEASVIALIVKCPLLETLNIFYENLTDSFLSALADHCPNLLVLALLTGNFTDAGFQALTSKCTKITELTIRHQGDLSDQGINSIATHCKYLQKLDLAYTYLITDRALCRLFESCTQLTHVSLEYLPLITDRSILTLVHRCPDLKSLSLFCMKRLTDRSILALVALEKGVETLYIDRCVTLSDDTIRSLSRYCVRLKDINLVLCPSVTEQSLIALLTHAKLLRSIDITECGVKLTPELTALLVKRPSPRRLKVDLGTSESYTL